MLLRARFDTLAQRAEKCRRRNQHQMVETVIRLRAVEKTTQLMRENMLFMLGHLIFGFDIVTRPLIFENAAVLIGGGGIALT